MARVSGWTGTLGKPMWADTAEAQLHLPSRWHRLFQGGLGAMPNWKPTVRSCQGQVLAPALCWVWGDQDPRFVALSPEALSSIPGLGCLESALPFPCTPAAQPVLPPVLAWGAPPRLSVAQDRLCGCFSVLPPPWRASLCSGAHPGCHGVLGGIPSSTAAATPGWFAHGQPKVEGKGFLARFGRNTWRKQSVEHEVAELPGLAAWTPCSRQPCWTCNVICILRRARDCGQASPIASRWPVPGGA